MQRAARGCAHGKDYPDTGRATTDCAEIAVESHSPEIPMNKVTYASGIQPSFGMPWIPPKTKEELARLTLPQIQAYAHARAQADKLAEENPIAGGWTLPMWQLVNENFTKYGVHVICGGNRSSKSTYASRLCTWLACTIPGAELHAYQVNKEKSVDEQQKYVWDSIPLSIKNISSKRGTYHTLQYSQRNGFTGDKVIFPPISGARSGGSVKFHNYAQYFDDPNSAESFRAHAIWLDEECPVGLFDTLLYRTIDYHGRIILTFTTIQGWSPLVQKILGKTRTIKKRFAPLLGCELPIMQESISNPDTAIYYFWTEDNAFIDAQDVTAKLKGKPKDEIKARAYGIPTKSVSSAFRSFDKQIHVIRHEDIPFIKDTLYPVTRYQGIDPGGSKPWVMSWLGVTADGCWWIYAEWPDISHGEWALPGPTVEGKAGPAQQGTILGYKDIIELIADIEKETGGEAYERFIDPRAGATERQTSEGATTHITELDDNGLNPPVRPAPVTRSESGKEVEVGLGIINDKLAWREEKGPDGKTRRVGPRLFISDRCEQMIYCFSEYTAKGGSTENTKDFVDTARYVAVSDPQFFALVRDNALPPTGVY